MADRDWRPLAYDYGPHAIVAALLAFMLWIRTRSIDSVIRDDAVYFSGNDPWYHSRIVHLAVRHFPATPNFDPWSRFPYGTGRHSGFGGLFDQLIAFVALVLGGGSPDPHFVDVVIALAPPVFGAATAIPAYLIARRLTDKWSGLLVPGLLALAGGQFLSRTVVGTADHQSAEAFFGSVAVLGFLYAVGVVYREQPTTADVRDRNWIVLRRPVVASLLGGLAVASYLMMWPPGVMLAFTMGVFVVLQLVRDHLEGQSTEYLAFGTAVAMGTGGVLALLYAKSYVLHQAAFSLLQPLVLFGIAGGALVLAGLADYMNREGYEADRYPVAVAAAVVVAFAAVAVVLPQSVELLVGLVRRVYSFGLLRNPSALTVAEIQAATLDDAWRAFGFVFYVAVVGLFLVLVRVLRENRPAELLVLLWSLTIFSAYFSMIRFGYYMAVNVAVLAGFAIWWAGHRLLALGELDALSDLEAYQVIGVAVILIAVVPGNVVAVQDRQPVWETADQFGPSQNLLAWNEELTWMSANTPEESLDYYALYEPPADGDFDYPEGTYGVMSWWDYGHWITVQGQRIPFANPFQQGPNVASAYLRAPTEERANLILDALPSLSDDRRTRIDDISNERLRSIADSQSAQKASEDVRYVVIDDLMAGGKFGAIATWTGPGPDYYVSERQYTLPSQGQLGGPVNLPVANENYDAMVLSRLYFDDASGLEHYRLVHETDRFSVVSGAVRGQQIRARTSFQLRGGWEEVRPISQQIRAASAQGQLVPVGGNTYIYDGEVEASVKTFERVEGARLTGRVDAPGATNVTALLRLQTSTGRNFTYVQRVETDESGRFSMTVPYATDDAVGTAEGGTDSGVTARGNYTLYAGNPFQPAATGQADVRETAIYEGRTVEVAFREVEAPTVNATATDGSNASAVVDGGVPGGGSADGAVASPIRPSIAGAVQARSGEASAGPAEARAAGA